MNIDDELIKVLANENTKVVNLAARGINNKDDLLQIVEVLDKRKNLLVSLDLSSNNITDELSICLFNIKVKQLNLSMNELNNRGVLDLVANCSNVTIFNFSHNWVDDSGAQELINYAGIKKISLEKNNVSEDILKEFNNKINKIDNLKVNASKISGSSTQTSSISSSKATTFSSKKNNQELSTNIIDTLSKQEKQDPAKLAAVLALYCPEAVKIASEKYNLHSQHVSLQVI